MADQAKAVAPTNGAKPLDLIPAYGLRAKDGKPWLGINLHDPDEPGKPLRLSRGVLDLLGQASEAELIGLREQARKALLWVMTHKCESIQGKPVLVPVSAGPKTTAIRGESFR